MYSEIHQEKNGERDIRKEKSARESKSAVPRQEREMEDRRANQSRPCRVKREMEDRRARIGAGCAASKEKRKGGDRERIEIIYLSNGLPLQIKNEITYPLLKDLLKQSHF